MTPANRPAAAPRRIPAFAAALRLSAAQFPYSTVHGLQFMRILQIRRIGHARMTEECAWEKHPE